MNHILPIWPLRPSKSDISSVTVSYHIMSGNTSGVAVANKVYVFLLVNEEICINCHHLYQSLQRLPALNPNQTSYRETYWSLRLLHSLPLVICEIISYSPLHLADLWRPILKLHIIHLFIIKGHEYHWVKELSVVLKWASQTKELSGIKTVLIYCSLAVFIFISGAWGAWWVAFLCSW